MPNHVTNIIHSTVEVVHALLTEDGVDFERVIPMPDNVIRGGIGQAKIDGVMQKVYYVETPDPEDPAKFIRSALPYPEGATDWYEWSIENWGTKWNAYDDEVLEDDTVARFDTAWSHPFPVVKQLSRDHPDDVIAVVYADEDLGCNFGAYFIQGGLITWIPTPEENTPEAADFAALVKYGQHYSDLESLWDEDGRRTGEVPEHISTQDVLRHVLHGNRSA